LMCCYLTRQERLSTTKFLNINIDIKNSMYTQKERKEVIED
jgi:hypothetical protein